MIKKTFFIFLLVVMMVPVYAGRNPDQDTNLVIEEDSLLNFDANLDSLLNLWYVGQYEQVDNFTEIDSVQADSLRSSLTDSLIISRLQRIPSVVELSYNNIVRRYIDVYAVKRREQVSSMLGVADYYFPIFDQILDYYGIPNELKYLTIVESALNPRAYSRARAVGIWQFIHSTGKRYGLTINSLVDERMDPMKSTVAACKFMAELYSIYQDWTLVIAAYNCGPGNVNRAIRRTGGKRNYWEIYFYLPRETRGYVPAYIAATYIMNYYREHNISPQRCMLPVPIDTIMVTEPLHLGQVSEVLRIPLKEIRDLNPQYFRDIIPAYEKSYPVYLPMSGTYRFIDLEDSIYAYKDSVFFNAKVIANPASMIKGYVPGAPDNMTPIYYKVKSGDNLGSIAMKYHVRVSDIQYWNGLHRTMIRSGQKLVIYVPKTRASQYKKDAGSESVTVNASSGNGNGNGKTASLPADADQFEVYTVKYGDTLWDIAKQFPGISETDLMEINGLKDGGIKAGQVIKIRRKS